MRLTLPSLDVEKADPNTIGEHLREAIFDCPPGETGCYSCFDVVPMAEKIPDEDRENHWRDDLTGSWGDSPESIEWELKNILESGESWRLTLDGGGYPIRVDCHWFWDGDGTLEFILSEQKPVHKDPGGGSLWDWVPCWKFYNTDCKKNNRWVREHL